MQDYPEPFVPLFLSHHSFFIRLTFMDDDNLRVCGKYFAREKKSI